MAGIAELLAGGDGGGLAPYLAENPYYIAGNNLKVAAPPPSILGKGAMWTSALQNLLSGVLQGYGRRDATNTAYSEYAQNPMLKNAANLKAMLADSGVDTSSMLNTDYSSPTMPKDWTPRVGDQDLNIAAALMQQNIEQKAAERKLAADLQNKLTEKQYDVLADVEKRKLNLPTFEQEQKIKGKYDPSAANVNVGMGKSLPDQVREKIVTGKANADQAMRLANEISKTYPDNFKGWLKLQGAKTFSGLDERELLASALNLKDYIVRSRTGATAPRDEMDNFNRFILGDRTASPAKVVALLRRFAKDEALSAQAQIDIGEQMANGDMSPLKNELNKIAGVEIITGSDGKDYRVRH